MAGYHINDEGRVRRCSTTPEKCDFAGGQFESFEAAQNSDTFKEIMGEQLAIPKLRKASQIELEDDLNDDEKLLSGLSDDYSNFDSKYEYGGSDEEDEDEEPIQEAKTIKSTVSPEKAKQEADEKYGAEHAESGIAEGLKASTLLRHATNSGNAFDKGYISKLEELAKEENTAESLSKLDKLKQEVDELRKEKETATPERIKQINGEIRGKSIHVSRMEREQAKTSTGNNVKAQTIEKSSAAKTIDLKSEASKLTKPVNAKPTEDDAREADYAALTEIANNSYGSWERYMGKKSVTNNSVREFHNKLRNDLKDNPISQYRGLVKAEMTRLAAQRQYARDYETETETPENKAFFEKAWKSKIEGQDITYEEKALKEKREAEELQAKYERGEITPGKIIGGGYKNPKKVAREYLERRVETARKIVETKGRSDVELLRKSGLLK